MRSKSAQIILSWPSLDGLESAYHDVLILHSRTTLRDEGASIDGLILEQANLRTTSPP